MRLEQTTVNRVQPWHTQLNNILRNSYDLLLLIGLGMLLPGLAFLSPLIRVPLGLAVALIAPGYALAAVLFPRRDDLDGMARATVSFGLSIAVLPLLALLLSLLPWGIQPLPIVISLAIWILLFSHIALGRRWFLASPDVVYMPPVMALFAGWRGLSVPAKTRYTVGALALGALVTTGAILLLASAPSAGLTEFYILGPGGLVENYPRQVAPGEELTMTLGIMNREPVKASYHVQIWVSDGWNPEQRKLVAEEGPFVLSPGTNKEWQVSWSMPWAGNDQKVEFLLFQGSQPEPYRQLWLWVNVIN